MRVAAGSIAWSDEGGIEDPKIAIGRGRDMSIRLLVTEGPNRGQSFPLVADAPQLVGRGRDAAVQLLDPRVSRQHCWLAGRATACS
jgi:hypothetical protein